jgi:hypothetical protein
VRRTIKRLNLALFVNRQDNGVAGRIQAFEFWRDHLQPQGYGLKAMIVDWPQGLPGDIGFFLTWGDAKR